MKKIIKILLTIIAFVIIIFILLMFRNSFASFFSKITGNSSTEVAEPIFIMENTEKKLLNDENTEVEYYFNIKNFNSNGNRSENDLKYYIEIQPIVDPSITFTLYKDGTIVTLNNQKTDYIELTKDNDVTHSYKLKVKYEREKTNSTIDIKENIYIKAYAIQS